MSFVTLTLWAFWSTSQTLGPPWRERCCFCFEYWERGNEGQRNRDLNKWAGLELKADLPLLHKARRTEALSYVWMHNREGNGCKRRQCQIYVWFSAQAPLIQFNLVSLVNSSLVGDWSDEVVPCQHLTGLSRSGRERVPVQRAWGRRAPVTALLAWSRGTAVLQPCGNPMLCCAERTALHCGDQLRAEAHWPESHIPALLFAHRNSDKTRRLFELVLKCRRFPQMQFWVEKKNFERVYLFCLQDLLPFNAAEWKHWYISCIWIHWCLSEYFVKGISAMRTNSFKSVFRVI